MFVGADSCKDGWFIVVVEDNSWGADVLPDMRSLWQKFSSALLILVDIPIGLPESGPRRCDIEARKLLGRPRRSSVFPVPCWAAISAETYEKASNINYQRTGKRLSRQTWSITPKIREVNCFLLEVKSARSRVREIHPEICFWALAGGQPMRHSKKTEEGFCERRKVLHSIYPCTSDIIQCALSKWKGQVAKDDVLDALSAAITAAAGGENLTSIPERPELDSRGLRMEMVYKPWMKP